ncbi:hypothetical protein [Micromonospora sp. WMMD712]|uniref:hypothetical protein n=1 Tax=Micromonospora sp. WMMD712 TaxID=3016096 RepID=UPI002499E461|nr:hypothetical protein [Micromonospora sp. WMMD712]WFE59986.1 hypothetical protein O7633_25465 [Micromonospora sp. WMMD712]
MTNHAPTGPVPTVPAAHPAPTPPPPVSSATRHLCAGAYLDEEFQRASLNEVYHQRDRLVAPSYGFDLPTVLHHCLRARRLAVVRDVAILGMLLLSACVSALATTVVIGLLALAYVFSCVWQVIRQTALELRNGQSASAGLIVGQATILRFRLLSAALIFVLVSTAMGLFATLKYAAAPYSYSDEVDPLAGLHPAVVLALLVLTLAPPVVANLVRQSQLDGFAPGRTPPPPGATSRFAEIRQQKGGNTVVFSDYRPFVGSGIVLKNWSFAQRLVRAGNPLAGPTPEAEREFPTAPFGAAELIAHLRDELGTLATQRQAEGQLPGLTVDDRIFLAGTEVAYLVPYTRPEWIPEIIRQPTAPARHFLVCQMISWRGELVTTVYVHVAVQGRSLYMDFTSTALPPCDERFRVVDQVGGTGPAAYLRAVARGLVDAPATIGRAPLNLFWAGLDALANSSWFGSAGPPRQGYDHGARVSVRELGMAADTRHHLQTQEVDKHQQIIERRLLAAVLDFLEDRGVDTSEYRQRAATLLNAGAIVTGGSLTVQGNVTSTQTNKTHLGTGAGR